MQKFSDDYLIVYWEQEEVGRLYKKMKSDEKDYSLSFIYNSNWKNNGISLSLPVSKDNIYDATNFFKFLSFEDIQLQIICRRLKIINTDIFSLLSIFGKDCAGALQIVNPEINIKNEKQILRDVSREIEDHITGQSVFNDEGYLTPPNLILDCKARLSLAGNQDKLPCVYKDGRIYVPDQGMSTHILKTPAKDYPYLPENEYICMKLAKSIGLDVPECELIKVAGEWCYVVERYDRENGKRLHQEDMAQALGLNRKYQEDGGPGISDCVKVLNQYKIDTTDFIKSIIFNYCIGNTDAHGRNYSILIPKHGHAKLAPLYDLVCTLAYPNLDNKMAMGIGNTFEFRQIDNVSWEKFADNVKISIELLENYKNEITNDIIDKLPNVLDEFLSITQNNKVAKPLSIRIMNNSNNFLF